MSILCVVQRGKDNRFLCPKVVLANGVLLLDRGHISYGLFIHQLPIDVAILSCLPSPNHEKSNHVTVREKLKLNFTHIPSEFRPMNSVPR